MGSLRFALALALAACSYQAPTPDGAPVDDTAVGFELATSGADEASNTVEIALVLSHATDHEVSVQYAVTGGTATPTADFTVSGSVVTFAAGEVRQQLPIAIVADNDESESNETIDLALSNPVGAALATSTHTVTISNEILPRVQFATVTSSTAESTQTMLAVTLDKAAAADATVTVVITGGQATAGADFALASGTVIPIPAGQTTAAVPIGEIDDALDEDAETVAFLLENPSPNILVGTLATETHTITDNDNQPVVKFAATTSSLDENGGTKQVQVILDAPSGKTITVNFAKNGADTAGTGDATVVNAPGTLTFAPGETTQTIDIQVNDDTVDENDETVIVDLSAAVNATLQSPTHTLTIVDDDAPPTAQFLAATGGAAENTFADSVAVTLSAVSEKTVTVPFTRGGTANDPADYRVLQTSVTFNPGETSKTIGIGLVDDGLDEDNETIVFTLGTPTNATLGATTVDTYTITDNDNPPNVSFDPLDGDQTVNEGDPPPNTQDFNYDVILSTASGRTVSVPFTVGGSASLTSDFTIQTASPLVFNPGQTRKSITVRVVRDTVKENGNGGLETVQLTLGSATNANTVSPTVRTHTIRDDD